MGNTDSISSVYFVEAVGLDLIKIGYAVNIQKRFVAMMTASPAPLTLLGTIPGGPAREWEIHLALAASRAHGEWFRKTPEVMAVVGTARPSIGQEWLNQTARERGAALQDYLSRMKAGEVTRAPRGKNRKPSKKRPSRYDWSPEDPFQKPDTQ